MSANPQFDQNIQQRQQTGGESPQAMLIKMKRRMIGDFGKQFDNEVINKEFRDKCKDYFFIKKLIRKYFANYDRKIEWLAKVNKAKRKKIDLSILPENPDDYDFVDDFADRLIAEVGDKIDGTHDSFVIIGFMLDQPDDLTDFDLYKPVDWPTYLKDMQEGI